MIQWSFLKLKIVVLKKVIKICSSNYKRTPNFEPLVPPMSCPLSKQLRINRCRDASMLVFTHWVFIFVCRRSYNTPWLYRQIEYRATSNDEHSMLILILILMSVCKKYCLPHFKASIYALSQRYEACMEQPYNHVILFASATNNTVPKLWKLKNWIQP